MTRRVATDPEPEPTIVPPFYEATEDLFVSSPDADAMPARAYRAGDRVVPDVVEANGWASKVRVPDAFAAPPAPAPASPAPEATAPASQPPETAGTEE